MEGVQWSTSRAGCLISGKELRYQLNMRLGELQSRYGLWKRDESLTTTEIRALDSPARSPFTTPTTLARFAHTLKVLFPSYEYRFKFTALQISAPLFVS